MPFILDTASAIKSRFGFHERSSSESVPAVRSTPDLLKSASKENCALSVPTTSAIRRISDWDDEGTCVTGSALPSQSFEISEDPSFWKDHNVQVIIRVRPLSSSEISQQGYSKCIRQESSQTITWTGHPESRFTFDLVADENVTQEKLFKVAGLPMVENCMGGYNSCMFAYGQTGSGKTHTMLGDIEAGTRRQNANCGMTPRVFEHLFSRIQKEKEVRKDEKLRFVCKCSFLEIYNEQILDLLDPSSNNLQIREDIKKGVHVESIKEVEVTNARDVIQNLIQGAANRKVAATNMNRASSRSHSVFTCVIESKWESQGVTHHRFARLHLVDLAGSERQKSSGAEGERLKEATNINKSLSTLGLVIMNLVNISNGKSLHVPYRDSKLTFLLQDSLGGNSKTTIIANISPSNCCSLETLSTLKFAQRAKFIKNNAIVNEDASGDVIAMRVQIQQLKKEVSLLRGMVHGGMEPENDTCAVGFPGSPGAFKWEGLHGSFSPLTSDKRRMSQKRDYDVALVGAFRREKEKDIALQALSAENQAAMRLAKQREDEIQGLKMRLRFREAGIKRLEAVASEKISAETHLLKEKEEYLKEIEVLRTQVDRNQEVTRFAMENLRLKEEIRRLKSFCEEGEREMLNEQIMVLENKLLEALDWKLMHESDSLIVQKGNSNVAKDTNGDADVLISGQDSGLPWHSPTEEENEFLRLQAIQNQAEMDTLREKLGFYLEEKENLQRHVNDLLMKLEEERSARVVNVAASEFKLPPSSDVPVINFNDQMELKTMVDAIAAASQREAEAHETAIKLSKENDELRFKLKNLIEDNNKLIDLYEQAASESNYKNSNEAEIAQEKCDIHDNSGGVSDGLPQEKDVEMKKLIESLEQQLTDMHEENEKLMGLYEKAMQERDDFKRLLSSSGQIRSETRADFDCPEKLVEVDGGVKAKESAGVNQTGCTSLNFQARQAHIQNCEGDTENQNENAAFFDMDIDQPLEAINVPEDLDLVRVKLEKAQEKILESAKTLNAFGSVEKTFIEVEKLSREIREMEVVIQVKQQRLGSLQFLSSEMKERKALLNKKLSALKYSLSSFSSSVDYFVSREARAQARLMAQSSYLDQKNKELARLQFCKDDVVATLGKTQQAEQELRNNISLLKSKLDEENRRQESEKVLFAIDNIEASRRSWQSSGKAIELLRSEEEKTKLQTEMKLSREKLVLVKKEIEELKKKLEKIDSEMQLVNTEIQKASCSTQDMERALKGVIEEKETLTEMIENGKSEIQMMILDYQKHEFEGEMIKAEREILEEELKQESRKTEELRVARAEATEKKEQLLNEIGCSSGFFSEQMEKELQSVREFVLEAKTLLGKETNNLIDS